MKTKLKMGTTKINERLNILDVFNEDLKKNKNDIIQIKNLIKYHKEIIKRYKKLLEKIELKNKYKMRDLKL